MTRALNESLELVADSVNDIANRTMGDLRDDPIEVWALRTLIKIRLQDLSKHKEIALNAGTLNTMEAADIMNLEQTLAISLAKCELYLKNPDLYREYVIYRKATVNRWKSRLSWIGFLSLTAATGFIAMKILHRLQPTIQRLDL